MPLKPYSPWRLFMTRPPENRRQTAKPPFQVVHCPTATAPATTSPAAATHAGRLRRRVASTSTSSTTTAAPRTIASGSTTWIELFI